MKLCAIDTETTDIDFAKAHIVEICILPLNDDYSPDKNIKPLNILINPGAAELERGNIALSFNKIGKDDILKNGLPETEFLGYLKGWMAANGIDIIEPLAHNWVYDRAVLRNLLGFDEVEKLIYRRAKDSHTAAVFVNDLFASKGVPKPFKQTRLSEMVKYFGMREENTNFHRAYDDCIASAFVYQCLLGMIKGTGDGS
jgi:DNA polymerase III epsilon subunit-like protein